MILIQHELETLRELATAILTPAGYKCRAAISPTEAWGILNSGEAVELLLCKVMESLEDGLIERAVEKFPDIPVVVWGCRPLPPFLEAMSKGAYDYLQVPFMREQLLAAVRRGLDHRCLKLDGERV
jgi:two-component system, NtrC family, C4-dicarboxylate transport response regulator DctD